MDKEILKKAAQKIQQAKAVCVLTGAGISAESGVPTFRGSNGLWQGHSVTELASNAGFLANPKKVWEFYNERRRVLADIKPNPGHFALAQLESLGGEFSIATQNVDRLHQIAGSRKVVELHGNIWQVRCHECHKVYDETGRMLDGDPRCASCGGRLRPAVVWFGESLPETALDQTEKWSRECDVFVVIGTSGVVYPAASFAYIAKQVGAYIIEINLEKTPISAVADLCLLGKSGEILPRLVY